MSSEAPHARSDLTGTLLVRRLAPFAWHRRGAMMLVVATTLTDVGLTLLQPWPLKVLVDNVLGGRPTTGVLHSVFVALPGPASREALLWWTVAATVVLFLLAWAAGLAAEWARVRFGERLAYDVAGALFGHLQRLSLHFHTRHGVGSLIRRIMDDSGSIGTLIQDAAIPAATAVVTLVVMVVIMLRLDALLTLMALAVIPAMALVMRRYSAPMADRSYEQQEAEGLLYETVEQTLTGLPVVQAFGQEPAADRRLAADIDRIMEATIRMTWAQFRFKLTLGAITALGTAAVFYVGAQHALSGRLQLGTIIVFLAYLGSLYSPLHDVSHSSSTVSEAIGSARRVVDDQSRHASEPGGAARAADVAAGTGDEGDRVHRQAGRDDHRSLGHRVHAVGTAGRGAVDIQARASRSLRHGMGSRGHRVAGSARHAAQHAGRHDAARQRALAHR